MSPQSRPQVETWLSETAAEHWRQGAARRAQAMAAATESDARCGRRHRRFIVEAARRVGPGGYVLATDLWPQMLAQAAAAAKEAGLSQVDTQAVDAQELDLPPESFDAAICRLGLMFIPDRHKALEVVAQLPEAEQELAWREIEQELGRFAGPDGCAIPGECLVGVGTK